MLTRLLGRWAFPALPIGFAVVFVVLPLALTIAVSFWTRVGLVVRPAFTFTSYEAFFAGARLLVLERSFLASTEATVLSLLLAYPIFMLIVHERSTAALLFGTALLSLLLNVSSGAFYVAFIEVLPKRVLDRALASRLGLTPAKG